MISFSVNFSQKSIHNEEIAKLGVFSAKIESKGILVEYMLDLLWLRSRIQRKIMQKFGPNSIWQRFSFFYNFSSTIKSYLIYKRLTHTLNVLIGFLSQFFIILYNFYTTHELFLIIFFVLSYFFTEEAKLNLIKIQHIFEVGSSFTRKNHAQIICQNHHTWIITRRTPEFHIRKISTSTQETFMNKNLLTTACEKSKSRRKKFKMNNKYSKFVELMRNVDLKERGFHRPLFGPGLLCILFLRKFNLRLCMNGRQKFFIH